MNGHHSATSSWRKKSSGDSQGGRWGESKAEIEEGGRRVGRASGSKGSLCCCA